MSEVHRLTDQVVGIYDDPADVTQALRAAGYETEVITGEEGREHLDPTGEEHGIGAKLLRLASLFGDERPILDRFDAAVERGQTVVAAHTDERDPAGAVEIMKGHGGEYLWQFESGTHLLVAD